MKYSYLFFLFLMLPIVAFSQINHWETAVYAEDVWRYQLGTNEPAATWRSLTFNDAAWPEGQGSIGYGDGDDNTIIPNTPSIYMRRTFMVTDKSKINMAAFHADYDDGFVAYLNGVEIARANLEGNPPSHNTSATEFREALMYSGGLPVAFYINEAIVQQLINNGENILAIQTNNFDGAASSDMTSLYWLSFGINDTSNDYGPTPIWFMDAGFETSLPIVKINTGGAYIPDEPSIPGEMGIIWNGDGNLNSSLGNPNEFLGNIIIQRRGQSSLGVFPKNGYAIETKDEDGEDMDVSFLNFPEEEDWILHGPYSDKTLIRNVLAMHIAQGMGQYASRTRLVELIINEQYEGVYVIMERIKSDEHRVDIANLKPEDIAGDDLTGGYVFKIDKGPVDWYSQYSMANLPGQKLAFQYVSPKRSQIMPEQEAYIKSYVDSFENAMLNPNIPFGGKRYYEYIDLTSFAEHFILSELSKNVDAYRISTYMHKDKDSKGGLIKAGPVWDYNLGFGNADYCDGGKTYGWMYQSFCGDSNPFWWDKMLQDQAFVNTLKCRWLELRENTLHIDTLHTFIDQQAALLNQVVDRNFERWPVLDIYIWPNAVVTGSYQGEIDYIKSFVAARIAWMDSYMSGSCTTVFNQEIIENKRFNIHPNPADRQLFIEMDVPKAGDMEIIVFDVLGRPILTKKGPQQAGKAMIGLDLAVLHIKAGVYFLKVKIDGELLGVEQVVLK